MITKQELSKEQFLGAMMAWCFKFGCEVTLSNVVQNVPCFFNTHEYEPDGSILDMEHRTNHKVIEFPQLIFQKGERKYQISAHNWQDLIARFEYEHKRIFMELSVPFFNPRNAK